MGLIKSLYSRTPRFDWDVIWLGRSIRSGGCGPSIQSIYAFTMPLIDLDILSLGVYTLSANKKIFIMIFKSGFLF